MFPCSWQFLFQKTFILKILFYFLSQTCITGAFSYLKYNYLINEPPPYCSDYEMMIINTKQCVLRCPIRCLNGVCFEDGICPCDGYYQTSFGFGLVCANECLPGCIEAGGYCAAPDLCLCHKGLYFDAIRRRCRKNRFFKDRCRNQCLYGRCSDRGECICAKGYNYNATFFGQLCIPICKKNCGPQSYCILPNMCACKKKNYHYESDGKCHKDNGYLV